MPNQERCRTPTNPPYIRQEWLAPFKPYWEKRYRSYHGVADIFVYFFEQSVELLQSGGQMAFITSGSWVRGNFGAAMREFLSGNARMTSMVDFGEFQPFEDAEMIRPSITILTKDAPGGDMRSFKWLTSGRPPEALGEIIAGSPTIKTERFGKKPWKLEPDDVLGLRAKLVGQHRTLKQYTSDRIFYGIKTGLNELFIIDVAQRDALVARDPRSSEIIKPLIQGNHVRPGYIEESREYLIALKSSANFKWPWSEQGDNAEQTFGGTYPAVFEHLNRSRSAAIKRTDQGVFWWELRSCDYWDEFIGPKIVWPDISKLPRFSIDAEDRYLGNTGYIIPGEDYFLLGVLSSWATWFFISKTAQPLRLRGDRWQYRLIAQFMEPVPIPNTTEAEQKAIADLARTCNSSAQDRYNAEIKVQRRLAQTFGTGSGELNQKAQAWWNIELPALGEALKQSFRLPANPMKNPHTADEWEPYLAEKVSEHARLGLALKDAEDELNDRVFRLFDFSPAEIALLKKEVEH